MRLPRSYSLALAVLPVAAGFLIAAVAAESTKDTVGRLGQRIVSRGTTHGTPACISCHGDNLQGNPAMQAPAIAHLSASFILERLEHFAGPDGHNPTMKAVATSLSPTERRAVAEFIAAHDGEK